MGVDGFLPQAARCDNGGGKPSTPSSGHSSMPCVRSILLGFALGSAMAAAARAQEACKATPIGTATVAAVRDGRTLLLADGRELRLAGIEVTQEATVALRRLAGGQPLQLEKLGTDHDRYGRLVAYAFTAEGQPSVQQTLLEHGEARVSARVGDKACAEALLKAENAARTARRGLWADPNFAPLGADNLAGLGSARGHFALVEGKVLSVRVSGGTIYLNFGRRWTRDFSVLIPRRNQRSFAAAGLEPTRLEGHRIRVRGFIEQRRGPIIQADAPEQIETTD